eukprot:CAMPEP_0117650040 /NCGR_PEP_ID=MMETSP0804-20121206/1322_1 /TAXON_ID=1074897 /ORGANISM="Tetraselmis astigmatica, Strain CCMP880" /LENGTH=183 /DNA_ID=CAMNT_0005455875 /DNA_START=637 /DNA_END=1188 /DNA_ORIENTATION=-
MRTAKATYGDRTIVFEAKEALSIQQQLLAIQNRLNNLENDNTVLKQDNSVLKQDVSNLQFSRMRDVVAQVLNHIHNHYAGAARAGWWSGFLRGNDEAAWKLHTVLGRSGSSKETRTEARALIDDRNSFHHLSPIRTLITEVKELKALVDKDTGGRFSSRSELVCAVLQKHQAILETFPDVFPV